jgi:hypothetical protein
MKRKSTPLDKTYLDGKGAYSKENKALSKTLVEDSPTHIPTNVHGRMLSASYILRNFYSYK